MRVKRNSGILPISFPTLTEALLSSAVLGYAIICYHNGLYQLVWWEENERFTQVLMWEDCSSCRRTYTAILDTCPDCLMQEEKVA